MRAWGHTLGTGFALALEQALHQALALDPASEAALRRLLEEPVLLRLEPFGLELWLTADQRQVHVQYQSGLAPALTLSGSPLAFAAASLGDPAVFRDGRLQVEGDLSRAQQLQRLFHQLDPDWEASLARVLGDIPAHFLARRFRQSWRWSQEARRALGRNLEEYLQEESDTLPARSEAEALFEDIDQLRLDTDRLAARLAQLEADKPHPQPDSRQGDSDGERQ